MNLELGEGTVTRVNTLIKLIKIATVLPYLVVASNALFAGEIITFDIATGTLLIPVVNVDDEAFYHLELHAGGAEPDIHFQISAADELPIADSAAAYFSSESGLLTVPNLDINGTQWVLNLLFDQNSALFLFDSILSYQFNPDGWISEVLYTDTQIDERMLRFDWRTYTYDGEGNTKSIRSEWLIHTFLDNGQIEMWSTTDTYLGHFDIAVLESVDALNNYFNSFWFEYNAEITSGTQDDSAFIRTADSRFLVNTVSSRRWMYDCAISVLGAHSWDSIVSICGSPP